VNFIVLLKQVPDITSIPADAWNHETGTLRRAMLDNMLNHLDLHALTCACRMRERAADGGKVVCVTMGLRMASEVLLDAMSRGADEGILLTDSVFAGADTSATARTLAAAIGRIEHEIFAGRRDYLVVAGMQSTDGDTAQVPAQIAEALGIDSIACVSGIEYGERAIFRRAASRSSDRVEPTRLPAVITLTDCTEPVYASFARTRQVRTRSDAVRVWTSEDLATDPATVGAKGSWTQVVRIFSPLQEGRQCRLAGDAAELVSFIDEAMSGGGRAVAKGAAGGQEVTGKAYTGQVFVYAEMLDAATPATVTLELITQARRLADALGEKVGVVLVGYSCDKACDRLISQGADFVYLVSDPQLAAYDSTVFAGAVAEVVLKYVPQIMLFGATTLGRELAPRVAYATGSGLTADCTELAIGEHGGKSGVLLQTRPALGGNIMATIISKSCRTQMATVRPGVLVAAEPDASRTGTVVQHKCQLRSGGVKVVSRGEPLSANSLAGAQVIVSGGGGVRGQANFKRLLGPLADALAGRFSLRGAVGASRRAVEHSYATRQMQIGQTGLTVSPVIYVAIGISGAVQHISAIQKSKLIIAINPDPKAAIFRTADVGLVGKAEVAIPQILEALQSKAHGK
jgi:electron transfer flavoprotein alpha subunit